MGNNKMEEYNYLHLNINELNLILDGLEDTMIRISKDEIKEEEGYNLGVIALKNKISKALKVKKGIKKLSIKRGNNKKEAKQ